MQIQAEKRLLFHPNDIGVYYVYMSLGGGDLPMKKLGCLALVVAVVAIVVFAVVALTAHTGSDFGNDGNTGCCPAANCSC